MPIGPDTDRQGVTRSDRSRNLQMGFVDGVARMLTANPDTGVYEVSDNTILTRADVEAQGVPFIRDTGTPVSEPKDWFGYPHETISDAYANDPDLAGDDLGDLVDPQDDTYEEEGTHGLPLLGLAAGAAMGAISKLTSDGGK